MCVCCAQVSILSAVYSIDAVADKIMVEVDSLVQLQERRENDFYNNDRSYKTALEEVALLKEMAMGKLKWWLESPGACDIHWRHTLET